MYTIAETNAFWARCEEYVSVYLSGVLLVVFYTGMLVHAQIH